MKKCLIIILACAMLLLGCGETETAEKTKISFIHGWGGSSEIHARMRKIYQEFEELNPDIDLSITEYADASVAMDKADDMLSVGKMPDIVNTSGYASYARNATKLGYAMDLSGFFEENTEVADSLYEDAIDTLRMGNGRIYTVPDAIEVSGYWYNEKLFDAAGVTEVPLTWDEFFADMTAVDTYMKDEDLGSACCVESTQLYEFFLLADMYGHFSARDEASFNYGRTSGDTLFAVRNDLDRLLEVSDTADNTAGARETFLSGGSAVYFNGIWESEPIDKADISEDIKFAPYPSSDGKGLIYFSVSSGYVIKKQEDSKKEEAVQRFLKYMLSDDVQTQIAYDTGQMPISKNVDFDKVEYYIPTLSAAIKAANTAGKRIRTLSSAWNQEKIDILYEYYESGSEDEKDAVYAADMINKTS